MRKPFSAQTRLDAQAVPHVQLNFDCRDEIVPVLAGLQYIYSQAELRTSVLELVAQDINEKSRSDRGREGLDYWHERHVPANLSISCKRSVAYR